MYLKDKVSILINPKLPLKLGVYFFTVVVYKVFGLAIF